MKSYFIFDAENPKPHDPCAVEVASRRQSLPINDDLTALFTFNFLGAALSRLQKSQESQVATDVAEIGSEMQSIVQELREERAAIMEFDGGLSRAEAEKRAGVVPHPVAGQGHRS